MKAKQFKYFLVILSVLLMLVGCSKKIDHTEINDYADDILVSILLSLTQSDYETFSSHLSDDMKDSFDSETFQKESRMLLENAGLYEDIEFITGDKNKGYISAIYKASFSNEPDGVKISISFKEDDPEHKVYQLYMTSPKISEVITKS